MKTCSECGWRNIVNPQVAIEEVKCENCDKLLFKDLKKFATVTDGNAETKRKLLHDETPWDFAH